MRDWTALVGALVVAGALIVTGGAAVSQADAPGAAYEDVVCIAHRGNSHQAPENTLVAYREASEAGADLAECDVDISADDVVVLMHDRTVDRTTDGEGEVQSLTVDELKELDAGSWKSEDYAGEPVPTLSELLAQHADDDMQIVIEIKAAGIAEQVVEIVREHDAADGCVAFSFDRPTINAAASLHPGMPCFWLTSQVPEDDAEMRAMVNGAVADGLAGLSVNVGTVRPEWVRYAHSRGLSVWVWTVNTPAAWETVCAAGVDGVITDRPGAFLEWQGRG
ncbi:MAG: glycerophosphodiester phosphodiesterase [Armatimonadia bacterium]|nr:glycerophosphodiester phosphodiesterase [Armatimonadia bacterium]